MDQTISFITLNKPSITGLLENKLSLDGVSNFLPKLEKNME